MASTAYILLHASAAIKTLPSFDFLRRPDEDYGVAVSVYSFSTFMIVPTRNSNKVQSRNSTNLSIKPPVWCSFLLVLPFLFLFSSFSTLYICRGHPHQVSRSNTSRSQLKLNFRTTVPLDEPRSISNPQNGRPGIWIPTSLCLL